MPSAAWTFRPLVGLIDGQEEERAEPIVRVVQFPFELGKKPNEVARAYWMGIPSMK